MYRYSIQRTNSQTTTILIPSKVEEIKLSDWARFNEAYKKTPEWFQQVQSLADLSLNELSLFTYHCSKLLEAVTGQDFADVELIKNKTVSSDVNTALLTMFVRYRALILNYEPKERKSFVYKGREYFVPHSVLNAFTGKAQNPRLTLNEGFLLLQIKHNYNKAIVESDSKGIYYMLLTMIATIARRKDEVLPLTDSELEDWTAKRMKYFEDLSMDVALDFWFFFARSFSA